MKNYSAALVATLAASALLPTVASAAEPACKYIEMARLPLRYAGIGLDIMTDGSINGTPASMLVDTGASHTYLTRTATDRRQLVLRNTGRETRGFGGYASIYQTRVDEFSIGPARLDRSMVRVLTEFGSGRPTFEALVGAPFLLQSDLEISLATKELKFFRPKECGNSFLAYWDQNAIVLPFTRRGNSPFAHFTVIVNGTRLDAIIDSGASTSHITLNAAKRAGLQLDAPDVMRMGHGGGVGTGRVARWRTNFKRFEIGAEVVHNAEVGVLDAEMPIDVFLGADFLRSHRVLLAMSQQKIYLSYIGGEPFGQRHRLEPWVQAEADAGNADAQMALSMYYAQGRLVPRDLAAAAQWLDKAALGGNAEANILTGRRLLVAGKPAEAATRLRAGLDKLYWHGQGALWLHNARVRTGQAALAQTELAAARAFNRDDEWPAPIADFYLGKLNAAQLLEEARDDRKLAGPRTCESLLAMSEWHQAQGNEAALPALTAQRTGAGCKVNAAPLAAPPQPQS